MQVARVGDTGRFDSGPGREAGTEPAQEKGIHMSWISMDVLDVTPTLVGPGEEIGEDVVPEGKLAVVLGANGDNVAVIGTPQQLRERVAFGLSLAIPDGVALFDVEGN